MGSGIAYSALIPFTLFRVKAYAVMIYFAELAVDVVAKVVAKAPERIREATAIASISCYERG